MERVVPGIDQYVASRSPIHGPLSRLFRSDENITIFDIGACEGEDSIRYLNMFPRARVYAFEPLPKNVQRIRKNIERFDKQGITIFELALSDKGGTREFHVSSGQPGHASSDQDWDFGNKSSSLLKPDKVSDVHPWLKFESVIEVQTSRMDEFCLSRNIDAPDLMHLDVQGAELLVLEGAGDLLRDVGVVWMEVERISLYEDQPLKGDVERYMRQRGFIKVADSVNDVAGDQLFVNRQRFPLTWIGLNYYPRLLFRKLSQAWSRLFAGRELSF